MQRWSQEQDTAGAELAVLADDLPLSDVTRENKLNAIEKSRFADVYLEVAPSLAQFGRLLGRAFEAQTIIAACNKFCSWILSLGSGKKDVSGTFVELPASAGPRYPSA